MSGTLSQPSGVPSIAYTPTNPLTQAQGAASLANTVAENALIKQNTQNAGITGQQLSTNLQTGQANRAAQVIYGLSNLTDDQLKGGQPVRDALLSEYRNGTINQQTYNTWTSNLPSSDAPVSQWRQSLNSHMIGTLAGPAAVQAVTGTPFQIDNGQVVQGGMQAGPLGNNPGALLGPNGKPVQSASGQPGVQKTTSPDTNATLTRIWNPATKQFDVVPRMNLPGATGIPGNGGFPTPPVTPPASAPASGTAAPATAAPSTATTPPGPAAVPGGTPVEPPMGAPETLAANQKQYQSDVGGIPDAQQRIVNLQEAHRALSNLATSSPGSIGPGADKIQEWKQAMVRLGMGTDQTLKDVNDYATANKYFANNAVNLPSARSDASLQSTLAGQPSTHIPPDASLDLTKQVIGGERQRIAQAMTAPADASGNVTGAGYQTHSAQFANTNDRRAYAWDMYTQAERDKIMGSLSGTNLTKFQRSLGIASRLGLVDPNGPAYGPAAK